MLDDRDYMRRPREKPTPGRLLRSAWGGFVGRLRWLCRFCWPQPKAPPPPVERRKPDEEFSTDEFLKNEVDPILEKISAKGMQSLTARERQILETAREKINRP
jgi:hypothetical protein